MQLAVRRETGRRNQDLTDKGGDRASERGWMEEKDAAKHQNATKQNIPRRGNNNERATNSGGGYGVSKRPRPSTMPKAPKQRGATQRKSIKNREGRKTSGRDGEAASATSAVARSDAASPVYEPRASCRVYHFLPPLPKCPLHRLSGVYECRGIISIWCLFCPSII